MEYQIHQRNGYFQLELTLKDDAARVSLPKVHYTLGHFDITSIDNPTVYKRMALFYKRQSSMKPLIQGQGTVLFKTTAYQIETIQLEDQAFFIQSSQFLAGSNTLTIEPYTTHSPLKRMMGEPKYQTKISGSGIVFLLSPGPLICIELEKLPLKTTSMIVAREASTHLTKAPWTQNTTVQLAEVKKEVTWLKGPGKVYLPEYITQEAALYRHMTRSLALS